MSTQWRPILIIASTSSSNLKNFGVLVSSGEYEPEAITVTVRGPRPTQGRLGYRGERECFHDNITLEITGTPETVSPISLSDIHPDDRERVAARCFRYDSYRIFGIISQGQSQEISFRLVDGSKYFCLVSFTDGIVTRGEWIIRGSEYRGRMLVHGEQILSSTMSRHSHFMYSTSIPWTTITHDNNPRKVYDDLVDSYKEAIVRDPYSFETQHRLGPPLIMSVPELTQPQRIELLSRISTTVSFALAKRGNPEGYEGELSMHAAEQVLVHNSNLYVLIPKLHGLIDTFKSQIGTYMNFFNNLNSRDFIANAADAELATRYGIGLTTSDLSRFLNEIVRALTAPRPAIARARSKLTCGSPIVLNGEDFDCQSSYHLKLWYDSQPDHPMRQTLYSLVTLRLIPSLTDAWDAIPYSFILDWLFDVSETLRRIDAQTLIAVIPVRETVWSSRHEFSAPLKSFFPQTSLNGFVRVCRYHRYLHAPLTSPPLTYGRDRFNYRNILTGWAIAEQIRGKRTRLA